MAKIEEQVRKSGQELAPIDQSKAIEIVPETRYGYLTFLRLVFHRYTKRAILGATLMITQSFLYNAIFFTYALVLINFYHVPSSKVPLYRLAFSIGNLLGPASYGALIGNGSSRTGLFIGYLIGAGIMLIGGLVEVFLGVQAAGKSLEQVTKPLTSTDQPTQAASTVAA